jgi:hypothetical protein
MCDLKRKHWIEYWAAFFTGHKTGDLPEELHDLTCGAKTRAGHPCRQKAIYRNGRCKWHGGLSTGPKTDVGREQSRINGKLGGRPRKPKP